MKEIEYKNLGCANCWREDPPEYVKCREQKHELNMQNLGRCYNQYSCDICKIYWTVDSSD